MITDILIKNGFTEKEAKLYMAVLEGGELTLAQAAKKAGLKRSTVYSLVEGMKKQGYVSLLKQRGIHYITALSPRLLIEQFEHATQLAKSSLPQLIDLAYASPMKPRIYFYEGIEGIKKILMDAASCKRDYVGFIDYALMPKELYVYIREKVAPERSQNKTFLRLLMPKNEANKKILKEYVEQVEHRLVNFPSDRNHIEILIYDHSKIGFMSFVKNEMFGLVLDSEAIHQTLEDLFMLIWEQNG